MPTSPNPENCSQCGEEVSWEWVPPVLFKGKTISGTGEWQSRIRNGACPDCIEASRKQRAQEQRAKGLRENLIKLLGGEKPYQDFTFEKFQEDFFNHAAFESARGFDPRTHNLYLWGPCGIGKTHLAYAVARTCFEAGRSVVVLKPSQLMRRVRKKEPEQEQGAIDGLSKVDVFVLDELGIGNDTSYARQIFQEILDTRIFNYRAGLIITSKYSPDELAKKLGEDTIPSRLAGMCRVIEVKGLDRRLQQA